MAGWLSSKLKEAEHFLQQIDQQAAESLGKPEKEKHDGSSKDKCRIQGNKLNFDSSLADQKDVPHTKSKLELGSELLSHPLSKLKKKSDQGPRVLNGSAKPELKGPSLYRNQQLNATFQGEANSQIIAGKDDWTELLSSPGVDLAASPALASSVGSSDSGRSASKRKQPSKFRENTMKGRGFYQQSDDTLSLSSSRGASMNNKMSPSASFLNVVNAHSHQESIPGRFEDETLKRQLEIDLVGLVGSETVADTSKDSSSKKINMNGVDLNTVRKLSDSENLLNAAEDFDGITEEDRANDARLLLQQIEEPRTMQMQMSRPSSSDSDGIANSANDKHGDHKIISRVTDLATAGRCFEDVPEGVHGMEKQDNSMQNDSSERDRSAVSDGPLAVDRSELSMAYEVGRFEELPKTQALPQAEEDSYDSTSMSDEDSDEGTESEDDEEIERRKSAHKKRIAKRKELAAAREAKAQAVITEHKLFVEKLEKEVISLQRILADREEQQGREAAELRTSIAEVMQALETEKKLHSCTRMKALVVESELENQNAELAKSLGGLQWELEEEISQISKVRRMIDAKEANKADLERRLAKVHSDTCSSKYNEEIKLTQKTKSDDTLFEEEQSDLWKKIQQCQIQVKDMEVKISGLKDTWHVPTEIEKELENRLAQLTDYLIQKQAQVEALSTERATLLIRLETLMKTIEEDKALVSSQASRNKQGRRNLDTDYKHYDMEYGLGRSYDSKMKHITRENGESSATASDMISIPFSPVLRQLNGFVLAGIFYLRKHRWAQAFIVVYIIILHFWFWFIVFMNSKPAQTLAIQDLGLPKNVSEIRNGSNVTNLL